MIRQGYTSLKDSADIANAPLPTNETDLLLRRLDCAVIQRVHSIVEDGGLPEFDSVRGVFIEGGEIYPEAGFREKTHVQIAVRNPTCIKGVFRVPDYHLNQPT